MKSNILKAALFIAIATSGAVARGDIFFQTVLTGAQEVPTNSSPATGLGTVLLNSAENLITVNLSFSGLTAPATAAHIHGPAGAGTNVGVIFPLAGLPAATSGSITQQSFAINPTQVGFLKSNLLYINVHNTNYPGGEIRGQLVNPCVTVRARISPTINLGEGLSNVVVTANEQACVLLSATNATGTTNGLGYLWRVDNEFPISLSPGQEPDGGGSGSGSGSAILVSNTLTINLSFSGLSTNASAAHIHGPAGLGTNAPVLYPLNPITTLGVTNGTIIGTVTLVEGMGGYSLAQQLQQLFDGLWYINIHSPAHPAGEIRGQLTALTNGAVVRVCLELGCHSVTVTATNAGCRTSATVDVCVVTPCEAIEAMIAILDGAPVPKNHGRQLIMTLERICGFLEDGKITPATAQLRAFQKKVHAHVSNPVLARRLSDAAEAIIRAVQHH